MLSWKTSQFLWIALNATTVNPYERGIRHHIKDALVNGVTKDEILEVLELCTIHRTHAITRGTEILDEVIRARKHRKGEKASHPEGDDRVRGVLRAMKDDMTSILPLNETIVKYDPEFYERRMAAFSYLIEKGPLSRKEVDLILLILEASTSNPNEMGLRNRIRDALTHGATPEEVQKTLELSTHGVHPLSRGTEIFDDVVQEFEYYTTS